MIEVVGWPLVGGIGLLVLLTTQPLGRPIPSLAQRLATLRPDPQPDQPPHSSFASPTLERLLVPPLRAAGRVHRRQLRPEIEILDDVGAARPRRSDQR